MTAPSPADESLTASWLLDRTEALCRADTTTGREDHGLPALRALLTELGAEVELQPVAGGRHNVLATWGRPRILFTTHLDTVPPFLPPRRSGDVLSGRGTCDAKGQIVAQLAAIRALQQRGHDGFAWLGVVGEETDSIGAVAAEELAPRFAECVAAINGEPTQNKLATGQRGSLQLRLSTAGRAAHSGMPQLGQSAIWPLIDWLSGIRALDTAHDEALGAEIWNLGTIAGGAAPNVIPAKAEAMLFVRSVPGSTFADDVKRLAPAVGKVEHLGFTPPDVFDRVPGFEHAIVPFGSDAPRMRRLVGGKRVALVGPGSIEVAHTADEHVTGTELVQGSKLIVALAETLLGGGRR